MGLLSFCATLLLRVMIMLRVEAFTWCGANTEESKTDELGLGLGLR